MEYGEIILQVRHVIKRDSWRGHNFQKHSCFVALMMIEYPKTRFHLIFSWKRSAENETKNV